MEALLNFWKEYVTFLTQWSDNLTYIGIAAAIWGARVVQLFLTEHAALGSMGDSPDCGCPDTRVDKQFGIFGGPSGLTFGLPYFYVMQAFGMEGILGSYWGGFIYLQFFTSLVQFALFVFTALFSKKLEKGFRFFKSHTGGCGWVSASSPFGWIIFLIQDLVPDEYEGHFNFLRDCETQLLFCLNLPQVIFACILGSLTGTICVPVIKDVDHDHPQNNKIGFGRNR